ncbi:MAG: VOC family protein [Thermoplasmata archaeon]|nr:VOC family protein [Thermoplasmata archaeon]
MPGVKSPRIFRLLIPATDLDRSRRFYESLLGTTARLVAPGRLYLDCGDVILGILDYSEVASRACATPTEAIYLATDDLEGIYRRAQRLGCLSAELIHGDAASPAGKITVRPWGERSFYATDPAGNPLCFVDATTLFTGTARQISALNRGRGETVAMRESHTGAKLKRTRRKPAHTP